MLQPGNKLFISHRRIFDRDQPRYFLGSVLAYENGIVKVSGHSFVRDMATGNMIRKEDLRTKILSLTSGFFIVYELPETTDIHAAKLESDGGNLVLSDETGLLLNLAENARQGKI